jgi:hypothetical protein
MYRENNISKSTFNKEHFNPPPPLTGKEKMHNFLSEFTFWFNIFLDVRQKYRDGLSTKQVASEYYDYKPSELKKLCFIIKKLKEEANGRRIILLTLPVKSDFERYSSDRVIPLKNSLDSLSRAENFVYVDLLTNLELKEKDTDKLYFKCDGHWNEYANKLASEILLPILRSNHR